MLLFVLKDFTNVVIKMMKSLFLHEFGILVMTNIIGCMVLSIYNHLIVKPITLLTFFSKSLRSYIYEFQLHLWLMEPNRANNVIYHKYKFLIFNWKSQHHYFCLNIVCTIFLNIRLCSQMNFIFCIFSVSLNP